MQVVCETLPSACLLALLPMCVLIAFDDGHKRNEQYKERRLGKASGVDCLALREDSVFEREKHRLEKLEQWH